MHRNVRLGAGLRHRLPAGPRPSPLRRGFVSETSSSSNVPPPSSIPPKSRSSTPWVLGALALGAGGAYYYYSPSDSKHAVTSHILPMASSHFTPTVVESSEPTPLDRSTKLITLNVPKKLLPAAVSQSSVPPIYSVYIKDDDIQVERPYTPLFGIEPDGKIHLWVRRYENGEVGRWMHRKQVGDTVEIRGPVSTWDYEKELTDGRWDEIVMISGGTGITPFFQLIQSQLIHRAANPTPPVGTTDLPSTIPHLTLLHSSRMPSELPPPVLLEHLVTLSKTQADKFTMKLFVDVTDSTASFFSKMDISLGRIGRGALEEVLGGRKLLTTAARTASASSAKGVDAKADGGASSTAKRVLFLVCGPEPMIESIAGPRPRARADVDKTGILGELGYGSANVRRL